MFFIQIKDLVASLTPEPVFTPSYVTLNFLSFEWKSCSLHFDDAVTLLSNLKLSTHSSESLLTMKEIQPLVNGRVQDAFLSVQGSSSYYISFRKNSRSNYPFKPGKVINKLENPLRHPTGEGICYDCGEKGHNLGGDHCRRPAYLTKNLRGEFSKELPYHYELF